MKYVSLCSVSLLEWTPISIILNYTVIEILKYQLSRLLLESSQRSLWANLDSWNFKGLPYPFESGIGSCLRYEFFKIYGGYIFVELDLLRAFLSTWVVCEIGILPIKIQIIEVWPNKKNLVYKSVIDETTSDTDKWKHR